MAEPEGRIIIVTGATGALGRLVCELLDERGAIVIAVSTDAPGLESVAGTSHFACDLSDESAVRELASIVHGQYGRVDGLLHLVGGWRPGSSTDEFAWLEARILTTLRVCTLAFADELASSTAGRLAIVSSTAVDTPSWNSANYSTLKAASEVWVRAVAERWSRGHTAAAVSFAVRAIGDFEGSTSPYLLAEQLAALWNAPAHKINGARISLAA